MQGLEDVNLVSHLNEVAGTCQAGRTASDKADFLAGCRCRLGRSELPCLALPIRDEALEICDTDGLALLAQNAA